MNMGVKPVRYEFPKNHNKNSSVQAKNNREQFCRPCPLCTLKGFDSDHFPLSRQCGVKKLSSIDDSKVFPSCCCIHGSNYQCKLTFLDGSSRTCSKNCTHNGYPLNCYAFHIRMSLPLYPSQRLGLTGPFPW